MSSKYPAELDELSTTSSNSTKAENTHPALHNDANSAINAIEETLGVNPQGEAESVAARLEVEDWHLVGDPGEPAFATVASAEGPLQLWNLPGADFPGYGTKWGPEPEGYFNPPVADWGVPRLAFYKDPLGVVHLRGGALELGAPYELWDEEKETNKFPEWEATAEDFAEYMRSPVFTLPAGYRPDVELVFRAFVTQVIEDGSVTKSPEWLTIHSSGLITLGDHTTENSGYALANDLIRLDGISFRAA